MKKLGMLVASGLMAMLPSVASARPHFFFGFNFAAPFFAPVYIAPAVAYAPAAPCYVSAPVVYAAPPVVYAAPPVVYAPAYRYVSYGYPAYGYYHRVAYVNPVPRCYGGVTYYYGGYHR